MSATREDIFRLIGYVQDDLRNFTRQTEAKLVELRTMLAACDLPTGTQELACPHCGVTRPNQMRLADHLANVHGEPRLLDCPDCDGIGWSAVEPPQPGGATAAPCTRCGGRGRVSAEAAA